MAREVKFAKDYLDRLLFKTEPLEALSKLSWIWSIRSGASEGQPRLGLSAPEFHVELYLMYHGEVGNGGHSQFFFNPSGRHSKAVLDALTSLEFQRAIKIFDRACSVFPNRNIPVDDIERRGIIQRLPSEATQQWAALDRELWSIDRSYQPRLLAYLRKHVSEVLTPERVQ